MADGTGTEKKRILLVDDDEFQHDFVKAMLDDKYELAFAKSGKEAIDCLSGGFIPHLVLLDILLPNMDGWETFNRMRAISFLQNVPIVFLTSLDATIDENRGRAMGAADYIIKPYTKKDLVERIENAIASYKK